MSTGRKKKLIHRISKHEKVVVPMLSEDLIELFDDYWEQSQLEDYADEALKEDKNAVTAEAAYRQTGVAWIAKHKFWLVVHEKYGFWTENLGVRDGYALVTISKEAEREGMPPFLRKLMEKMEGDLDV